MLFRSGFSSARAGLAASKSLYTKLAERNDPRATSCIVYNKGPKAEKSVITTSSDSLLYLAPNGAVVQTQFGYNMSIFCSAQTAPTHMLSYHEILFLKAEAYARLGDNDKAFESLEAAVVAGILNAGVSYDEAINSIFWTSDGEKPFIQPEDVTILNEASAKEYVESIKHLFDANPLKEVMVQKYFAFWGANGESTEAYNDVRRLMGNNEDFITLENPRNEAVGFPLRLPYIHGMLAK